MRLSAFAKTSSSISYGGDIKGKSIEEIPVKATSLGEVKGKMHRKDDYAMALPLPPNYRQTSRNQVGFAATSSTVMHAGPSKEVPKGVVLLVNSIQAVKGVFQFGEEKIYNNSGRTSDCGPIDVARDKDATKTDSSTHLVNNNNHKALGRELVPYGENHTLPTAELIQEGCNGFQAPKVTVAVSGSPSKKRASTRRLAADRVRKARITENLKALEKLLPNSGKGNKDAALDDIIDYIKYLQLQVKALSESKLGGEATYDPFVHLEGFGHYLVHQHMLNEPLEEIVGRLMEVNMSAVIQLLETKGLYVMPTSLAEELSKNL
ncbi:hypothetical protein IFM89_017564 [Coptis chinensis]|uniref:BHLH domain-containing protein n=1 Tax=Coptis chinensis TaxID=261450 RepID=A0A835LS61_9MAGN|nr:hypothetical protein IFM89_017564 [Coptis chinensis]